METYDILMLCVLVCATLFGAIKGFAWQLASIASIMASYVVAYRYREPFSASIQADPPWNRFLAMLILYVGTSLVIWVLFRMISRTIDRMKLKEFDRQIGALFGLAKGALYCTLITLFAVTLLGEGLREKIVGSRSGHYISRVLDKSQAVIPPELHEIVHPVLEKFDRRFNGTESGGESGFLPSWRTNESTTDGLAIPGVDGNAIRDAIFDRLGNPAGSPTIPSPFDQSSRTQSRNVQPWNGSQPWNGNQPTNNSSSFTNTPPWQSGQSTPIAPTFQNAAARFGQTADQSIQQFNQSTDQLRQRVDQYGRRIDEFGRLIDSTNQTWQQTQQGFNQYRQSFPQPAVR